MTPELNSKSLRLASLLATGFAIVSAMPASADPSLDCVGYANKAIQQVNKAKANGCGFSGPRWTPNANAHVVWCLLPTTKQAHLNSERAARNAQINQCTGAGKTNFCNDYAQRAVNQQSRNKQSGCGFKGARWQLNFQNHFNWCMKVSKGKANGERNARKKQLSQCTGGGGGSKASFCNSYAQKAVNQQNANLTRGCGFKGARWQLNYQNHRNWCMKVSKAQANGERNARTQQLKSCP